MQAISYGTIPYLGTFLTDLTMIDTAISDITHDGLINFDKRRKEFEVLAQIKLLQGAANAYHIETDAKFNQWFEAVLTLDEREAFDLSCKVPFIYYVSTFKEGKEGVKDAKVSNKCPRSVQNCPKVSNVIIVCRNDELTWLFAKRLSATR